MVKLNAVMAVAAGASVPAARHLVGNCSHGDHDKENLRQHLSSCANVYYPGSTGFENAVT